MPKNIKIGMTDGRMYGLYANWIQGKDTSIEIVRLGYALDNFEAVTQCHALVFTGGEDVHPNYYQHIDYLPYCEPKDFDERRDAFEWKLLQYAEQQNVPILGICRGLQLINVYHGGTLIPDLPTWGKFNHAKLPNGKLREHAVCVDAHSQLARIVEETQGHINSLHHQSVDKVGRNLVASAVTLDGVIEAVEWKDAQNKPFLLLVQWHPERMEDQENPFVRNIREAFLEAI
ncbi:hypothetical protein GCM10023231_34260 [Olivibacter ginsenosidimutans]|uniref:Gamma-glutamyl-gamma-aminobutyrate hydrolase family protein n=1 Tax=Olivibacter ginsenosidimutans TaxID=1176537 RepID=A0ABP9BZ67_9SPHI